MLYANYARTEVVFGASALIIAFPPIRFCLTKDVFHGFWVPQNGMRDCPEFCPPVSKIVVAR